MLWFQVVTGCASIASLFMSAFAVKCVWTLRAELQVGDRVSQKAKGNRNIQVGGNLDG